MTDEELEEFIRRLEVVAVIVAIFAVSYFVAHTVIYLWKG